jgi:hypothetical protein
LDDRVLDIYTLEKFITGHDGCDDECCGTVAKK